MLRQRAERLMALLLPHDTWLLGSVAQGTADADTPIYLAHIAEQSKDLAMHLLHIELDAESVLLDPIEGLGTAADTLNEGLHLEFEGSLVQIRTVPRAQGLRRLGGVSLAELRALLQSPQGHPAGQAPTT